ncbi:hypothetical protein BU24DRAFT_136147 [Aaosphaeria arxii CBS 175.79]|uniref:Uncharacterized protein n=1 Tax=Aaosphaeria arxii CBS 175.79 TaxID=1450172 RepID=A0A6A5Y3Z4_9PLEO|nr:uncharacterized protein BU24DRAFT_136147 [Aaosphaeria arxii CBS 175.79]KAF2020272.1 hypothetical protein BU24DRAFT_136147 [Aaosphaeria arxii CBS 175.79]
MYTTLHYIHAIFSIVVRSSRLTAYVPSLGYTPYLLLIFLFTLVRCFLQKSNQTSTIPIRALTSLHTIPIRFLFLRVSC